jgi:ankyrin repeat protein
MKPEELALAIRMSCHKEAPAFQSCLFCGYIPKDYHHDVENIACQKDITTHMEKFHMQYFALASMPWDIAGAENDDSGKVSGESESDSLGDELRRQIMDDRDLGRFDTNIGRESLTSVGGSIYTASFYEIRRRKFEPHDRLAEWRTNLPENYTITDRTELLARSTVDEAWANSPFAPPDKLHRGDGPQEDASDYGLADGNAALPDRKPSIALVSLDLPGEEDDDDGDEEEDSKDVKEAEERSTEIAFLKLVLNGDMEALQNALETRDESVDINCFTNYSLNALHLAVLNDSTDCIKALADAGCNVNDYSFKYGTPLYLAAIRGNDKAVDRLIQNSANVNDHITFLGSPLHAACINGNTAIVKRLLDQGGEVDSQIKISFEDVEAVQALSPHNCGIDDAEIAGAANDQTETDSGKTLEIKKRLDPKLQSMRGEPLTVSAQYGHCDVVRLLIDRGADVDAFAEFTYYSDEKGRDIRTWDVTALTFACRADKHSVVEILLSAGAKVELEDSDGANPAVHASRAGSLQSLAVLVAGTPNVDDRIARFGRALRSAANSGREDCVRLLLESGIAADTRGVREQTPLMRAGAMSLPCFWTTLHL